MKKIFFIAAAAVVSLSASAQLGQFHIVAAGESKAVIKGSEIEKITYKGQNGEFSHMTVTVGGVSTDYAMDGSRIEVRGAGLPDTDLKLVGRDSEVMKLLTAHDWTPVGIGWASLEASYLPDYHKYDHLTFTSYGKVSADIGASNQVYNDEGGDFHYTPSGEEACLVGYNEEGELMMQFANGAYPLLRPVIPGTDLCFKVEILTESELVLVYYYPAGGYSSISFKSPIDTTDATARAIAAHRWKAKSISYNWGDGDVDEGPANELAQDDVLEFALDGNFRINGDGLGYQDLRGNLERAYKPGYDYKWSFERADDKVFIALGTDAFPVLSSEDAEAADRYEVVEVTDTTLKIRRHYSWSTENFFNIIFEAETEN